MTWITNSATLEKNIVRARLVGNYIVAIEDDNVSDSNVGSRHVAPISVEWKATSSRKCVDQCVAKGYPYRICIPPSLAIRVDPSIRDVTGADIVYRRTSKTEPVYGAGISLCCRRVDDRS